MLSGTISFFLRIIVSGPGQKASAAFTAISFTSHESTSKSFLSAICTISGLSEGLPFAAYIFADAFSSRASAPSPYTVSVGNATSPPFFKISAACSYISSSLSSCIIFLITVSIIISSFQNVYIL